jgi:hypothetical protein
MSTQPVSAPSSALRFLHVPLNALNAFTLFDLFDDALSDMFCLKTVTHGTSPKNYYSILSYGADPSQGGRPDKGEEAMYKYRGVKRDLYTAENTKNWDSKGRFYVFKDNNYAPPGAPCCIGPIVGSIAKKMGPRMYAAQGSVGELAISTGAGDGCLSKAAVNLGGIFSSFYSPTLKFRFLPEEMAKFDFQDDKTEYVDSEKDANGNFINPDACAAGYTEHAIPSDHIGLYGTLSRGFSGSLIDRIQADPWRFMQGLLKLITITALTALVVIGALYSPVVGALAMVFVAIETSLFVGRILVPIIASCFPDAPLEEEKPIEWDELVASLA